MLYRGCFNPSLPACGETLRDYLHAIQLSILFVARHISTPPHLEEPGTYDESVTKALRACLCKTLASFTQLLTSPLWPVLCRPHLWTLEYDDTIEVIARLSDYEHSRCLITCSLIEALEYGLLPFQLEEDRVGGIDGYLLYLYRARCKSQLERLRQTMVWGAEPDMGVPALVPAVSPDSDVQEHSEDGSEYSDYIYHDEGDDESVEGDDGDEGHELSVSEEGK